LLETQECVIKSDKHEFDVICALRYSSETWSKSRNTLIVVPILSDNLLLISCAPPRTLNSC
jgi:hypothetical protein